MRIYKYSVDDTYREAPTVKAYGNIEVWGQFRPGDAPGNPGDILMSGGQYYYPYWLPAGADGTYLAGQGVGVEPAYQQIPASDVVNIPAGGIIATNVQAAINELDTEKEGVIVAGTTAQYWRGDKTWQTLNQAAVAGLTTSDSPIFVNVKLSGLTDGYVPYHVADATGFGNSPIYYNGSAIGIGTNSPTAGYLLDVVGNIITSQTVDQETYSSMRAIQNASILQDGSSGTTTNDETFDSLYEAIKFTASGNHNIRSFSVRLKASATLSNPTATITGYLYSDNAGSPGTIIDTGSSIRYGSITTSYQEFPFGDFYQTLINGTSYWLVLKQSVAPSGGTVSINRGATGTSLHAYSTDGLAWTQENNKNCWHKIYGRTYYTISGDSFNNIGCRGDSTNYIGLSGSSVNSYGMYGYSVNNHAVYGYSVYRYGVYGYSLYDSGVTGSSTNGVGIQGLSTNNAGIRGDSTNNYGVYGRSDGLYAGYFLRYSSSTNAINEGIKITHSSSNTPVAGFGILIDMNLKSSTTSDQSAARISAEWVDATHATRKARVKLIAYDTTARECIRIEASGSAAMLGFLGASAIIRPTALTAQLTTLTHTEPGTPDYAIQDFVDVSLGAGWAFANHDEANSVLKAIANLQTRLAELEDKLGHTSGLGLITH